MSNQFKFKSWPTEVKTITQKFGARPEVYTKFGFPGHEGIDFAAKVGSKIFAVASGTVSQVFEDDGHHNYGTHVRVQHDDGYETVYAHLHEAKVDVNQRVESGQIVGIGGETGNTEGAHLHLTLKHPQGDHHRYPRNVIDPTPFVMPLIETNWNDATYLHDKVPDGTVMQASEPFTQIWTMRNSGSSTWGPGYTVMRIGGDAMGSPAQVPLPPAPPNADVPISILFHAPTRSGTYRSTWQPCDADGTLFGDPIWVEIEVATGQTTATPASLSNFIRPSGTRFLRNGVDFRFYGVNLRGLAHYGQRSSDPLKFSQPGHRESQLRAAYNVGARVARLFLADKDATFDQIEERLREVLQIVKTNFPDMYLLPAFTNLYKDVPSYPKGDENSFYRNGGRDLLNPDFFAGGYENHYLPFVKQIVTAFRDEPNIFAWEIGNELKLDRANLTDPADQRPWDFIRFNLQVAAEIKRLDPNHMVTTGMKSTHHAWLHTPELQDALYKTPNIDFITIHSYEGKFDHDGDRRVWDDVGVAARLDKPFIVEEAGFDIDVHPGRVAKHRDHLEKWLDKGTRGYMTWGFIHEHAIGDGDNDVGVGSNHADFDALNGLFSTFANQFNAANLGITPHTSPLPQVVPSPMPSASSVSIVGFDFLGYQQTFLGHPDKQKPINDAIDFGVTIEPAHVSANESYWRVVGIHHLEPVENKGKHNIYVDVLDESGQRADDKQLQVEWGWEGQQADQQSPPKKFDKPVNEPGTNLDLAKGPRVWLRIGGDGRPSDVAKHFHTERPDEPGPNGETWNSIGHHSFYVVFQRAKKEMDDQGPSDGRQNGRIVIGDPITPPPDGSTDLPPILPHEPLTPGVSHVVTREKLGIDANESINPATGAISARLDNRHLFAETGVGWVRLNFIIGPWSHPDDTTRHSGRTWVETYRTIIENLKAQGIRIYGLISGQAMRNDPGDQFRHDPSNSASNEWIRSYASTFVEIAKLFRNDVEYFETFNEPDDWHHQDRNWVTPKWFAIMLQEVHNQVRNTPEIRDIKIISGPLQGLENNGNAGAEYLRLTYEAGKEFFDWGGSRPFPFDGVGYHLYIAQNPPIPAVGIPTQYNEYMNKVREVIQNAEGRSKPIYLSEVGWRSNIGDEKQADCMRIGMQSVLQDPSVGLGFWFSTQDWASDLWGLYRESGLNQTDRKPTHGAFTQICQQPAMVPVATLGESVDTPFAGVDEATFVRETDPITDGTVLQPGTPFTKSWVLRNSGTTRWGSNYKLALVADESLGVSAPAHVQAPVCEPGNEVTLSVPFVTPAVPGPHRSTWRMVNPAGEPFGEHVWTEIVVTPAAAMPSMSAPPPVVAASAPVASEPLHASLPPQLASPQPIQPEQMGGKTLKEYDPDLYKAWSEHIKQGFQNNGVMFNRVLDGFMTPYYTAVWMYRILFAVGILAFLAAIVLAMVLPPGQSVGTAALFGGLSAASFVAYFLSRPLQALEENLQFITWLGIVYNTYWTRVTYAMDQDTFHKQIEDANNDAIKSIKEMLDKHAVHSSKRPGLR
ncbi:peptidoglycan DD-metalloendopeptidase family protein [Chloroflexi bacterium TSY]|nr:peptidoglycan DD-metalloendopeptidase family protein [Chloroflexi bacterium TSY]